MQAYDGLRVLFGDLHNHCGVSYGHGSPEDALANAREQLDFCSITGHAAWPDMPDATPGTQHIIDFHLRGFARLQQQWPHFMHLMDEATEAGRFIAFPGFEVHSCEHGDRTVVLPHPIPRLPDLSSFEAVMAQLRAWRDAGTDVLCFPHHLGYRQGQRGINWATFDSAFAPVVEVFSMHGCSEDDEVPRPFLHVMGPSDHDSTMRAGLAAGCFFGVTGNTDHHAAHPGSYGHGRTGVWATDCTTEAIWDAIWKRRTYALTGDRIELQVTLNGHAMGSDLPYVRERDIHVQVRGGGPIDAVDIVKNGQTVQRTSDVDVRPTAGADAEASRTVVLLELGWGPRGKRYAWDAELALSGGTILSVEPRFRGREVLAPEADGQEPTQFHESSWRRLDASRLAFRTVTRGNPNSRTSCTQGLALHVDAGPEATIEAVINGKTIRYSLADLKAGARCDRIGAMESPSYRFARAPATWEFDWTCDHADTGAPDRADVYWVRVRQKNDQWAWSSPIRVRRQDGE